jgi:hypothetical protein
MNSSGMSLLSMNNICTSVIKACAKSGCMAAILVKIFMFKLMFFLHYLLIFLPFVLVNFVEVI